MPSDIEGLFVELNFRKAKRLLFGTYYAPSQSDRYCFNILGKALDTYSNYDRVSLAREFKTKIPENVMDIFLYQHDLKSILKDKTCFKSAKNPSTIDLFLTNNSFAFQNTTTAFTGLSDCHKLVSTVLKQPFQKINQKNCFDEIIKNLILPTLMTT